MDIAWAVLAVAGSGEAGDRIGGRLRVVGGEPRPLEPATGAAAFA